jgi:hypothetical protein
MKRQKMSALSPGVREVLLFFATRPDVLTDWALTYFLRFLKNFCGEKGYLFD